MSSESVPTPPTHRIVSLDVIRGVAILGILLVNIQYFGAPNVALENPSLYGDFAGLNYATWALTHIFAEMVFITIFSLLFGVSLVLFMESKEDGSKAIGLHYRRMFWLLLIGFVHAFFFWSGDILLAYALCGFILIWARNWSLAQLVTVGFGLILIPFLIRVDLLWGVDPSGSYSRWEVSTAVIEAEVEMYLDGWWGHFDQRGFAAIEDRILDFIFFTGWRYSGVMMLGMVLYRWGFFSDDRFKPYYLKIAFGGLVGGVLLTASGVLFLHHYDWSGGAGRLFPLFNYWGSLVLALGYISLLMALCGRFSGSVVSSWFAAVGRTALTNYLFQTVIATFIFYGHGLGYYGSLDYFELLLVALGIWVIQIGLSVAWLSRFDYGPVEGIWRYVTYSDGVFRSTVIRARKLL